MKKRKSIAEKVTSFLMMSRFTAYISRGSVSNYSAHLLAAFIRRVVREETRKLIDECDGCDRYAYKK